MCIQFFLDYQHCGHHLYLGEQHCSDSPLCVRNAPLTYRLRDNYAAPRSPDSQSSDISGSSQQATCESCLSTRGEQLDPDQVPVQYYPPNNNFNVRLRRDAGFGKFVRVEEDQSDAKSLSDIDSDEEDWEADASGGGAAHECYDSTAALEHRTLLDKQLQNLPMWLAHQQAHQVYETGPYAPAQYWYTPWGVVTLGGTEDKWGGEGIMADGISYTPLSQPPSLDGAQMPLSPETSTPTNPSSSKQPQRTSYPHSTFSGLASIKTFVPRSPRSRESTAVSSTVPSRAQTPAEVADTLPGAAPPLQHSNLPHMRRDSILSRAPNNPRVVRRRSGTQWLDQLPERKVSLEHYVVKVKRRHKRGKVHELLLAETNDGMDANKENADSGVYDGEDGKGVLIDEFEVETETETETEMEAEVERLVEKTQA